jgi:tetrahydromethanopterin S-methyltransferase subunit G
MPDAPADPARVDEMEARLAELEDMQLRMAELEERVDFAERLLSRARDERQLSDRVP